MTTKRYNDGVYVKKTDPVAIPNKIKSNTNNNKIEMQDNYVSYMNDTGDQYLFIESK
jgi:hypothetical protein